MYVDSYVSNTIASQMSEYFPDNRNNLDQKTYHIRKLSKKILGLIDETFPNDGPLALWNDLKNSIEKELESRQDQINDLVTNQANIITAYKNATTTSLQRQILSLVANNYSKSVIMDVFKISKHLVDYAREHAKKFGVGSQGASIEIFRKKISEDKKNIYLDFIYYLKHVNHVITCKINCV